MEQKEKEYENENAQEQEREQGQDHQNEDVVDTQEDVVEALEAEEGDMDEHSKNTTSSMSKKRAYTALAAAVLFIAGSVAFFIAVDPLSQEGEVVARVNGEEITRKMLDTRIAQVSDVYTAQGVDVSADFAREEIESESMQTLINQRLLLQEAEREGVSVSEEAIEQAYQDFAFQFESEAELEEVLRERGFTPKELRDSISDQLILEEYIRRETEGSVDITDEEVSEFYEQYRQSAPDPVAFDDEIRSIIEEELRARKVSAIIGERIEALREGAEIEILI